MFQQQVCNGGHKLDDCIPEVVSGLESSTSSVPFLEGTPPPPPPAMFGSAEPSDAAISPPAEESYCVDAPPPSYADTVKQGAVAQHHRGGYCSASHSHDDCHESLESDYSDEVRRLRHIVWRPFWILLSERIIIINFQVSKIEFFKENETLNSVSFLC